MSTGCLKVCYVADIALDPLIGDYWTRLVAYSSDLVVDVTRET